jgi:hypothetical protein
MSGTASTSGSTPAQRKALPRNLPLPVQSDLLFRPESNPTGHIPFENADRFPFEPLAQTLSRVNAWWLAEAAWLAYWRDTVMLAEVLRTRAGLTSCVPIVGEGTHGFVASGETFAIAAFRGTQADDPRDLISDLLFSPVAWDIGRAHKGFAKALDDVQQPLEAALRALPPGAPVWFTGHSLGAAIATLAAWRHRARAGGLCTIGSPLVGSRDLTQAFDPAFLRRSARFVNRHDFVTRLPFPLLAGPLDPYAHVRLLRRIDGEGRITEVVDAQEPPTAETSDEMMRVLGTAIGIELPPPLADHTPLYYALHIWNDFATNGS